MAFKIDNATLTAYSACLGIPVIPSLRIAGILGCIPVPSPDPATEGHYLSERGDKLDYFSDTIMLWGPEFGLFEATCIPGKFYTENPTNPNGAAHLIPLDDTGLPHKQPWMFRKGLHKGQYECLVGGIYNAPFSVYRDTNRNGIIDEDERQLHTEANPSEFGIHIHHAGQNSGVIGKWSAGCQVLKNLDAWNKFYAHITNSGQTRFPYYLFDGAKLVNFMQRSKLI